MYKMEDHRTKCVLEVQYILAYCPAWEYFFRISGFQSRKHITKLTQSMLLGHKTGFIHITITALLQHITELLQHRTILLRHIRERQVWQEHLTLLRYSWWGRARCNGRPAWSSCSYYWNYWHSLCSSTYWDLNCQPLDQQAATLYFTTRLSGTYINIII